MAILLKLDLLATTALVMGVPIEPVAPIMRMFLDMASKCRLVVARGDDGRVLGSMYSLINHVFEFVREAPRSPRR